MKIKKEKYINDLTFGGTRQLFLRTRWTFVRDCGNSNAFIIMSFTCFYDIKYTYNEIRVCLEQTIIIYMKKLSLFIDYLQSHFQTSGLAEPFCGLTAGCNRGQTPSGPERHEIRGL